jgi:phosphohistidine phosphatase
MDLLLWRHAEAAPGIPDATRTLTPHGREQAQAMARWLEKNAPRRLRILVSPTVRTRQTIEAWRWDYELSPEIGVSARGGNLLTAVDWPSAAEPVLLVGHQPALGEAAALLLDSTQRELSFKKGSLWWFQYRERDAGLQTVLRAVIPAGFV